MIMNDPLLRTDSYAKIFLYNTHETVACVPGTHHPHAIKRAPGQAARSR